MEKKLIEAAKKGDVHTLNNLIKDDPLVLKASMLLLDGDSPLHIACLGGNLDFVKEFLRSNPELAAEKNQNGFSPLHIASADGNLEIVKELLKVGCHLCFVKGKDGRIPLHYAVCKGRKYVIKELLSCSLESIEEVTARGENCFHLAVTNNQFEAFKELVDFVVRHEKGEILNKKDRRGNNLLHLAAYGKQYEVFDSLLDENFPYKGIVDDINSLNKSCLTPLDVLLSNESGDCEIEEMVRASGGKRVEEMQATLSPQSSTVASHNLSHSQPEQQQISQRRPQFATAKLLEYLKFNKFKEPPSEVRGMLLILAVLIATTTFQVMLSPPCGVWQDDFWPIANSTDKQTPPHSAGEAVMGTKHPVSFGLLLLCNSMGFFSSLYIILFLTVGIPLQFEISISLFALTVAYDTCMTRIAPGRIIPLLVSVISAVLVIMMIISTVAVRDYWKGYRCSLARTGDNV